MSAELFEYIIARYESNSDPDFFSSVIAISSCKADNVVIKGCCGGVAEQLKYLSRINKKRVVIIR